MKFNGKILSVCALLVAVTACYGQSQEIHIKNATDQQIFGSVFPATLGGKPLDEGQKILTFEPQSCRNLKIQKREAKTKEFNTLIFSTDKTSVVQKVSYNTKNPNISSTKIKYLSGNTTLYYEITKGKDFEKTKKLTIKRVNKLKNCPASMDPEDIVVSDPVSRNQALIQH